MNRQNLGGGTIAEKNFPALNQAKKGSKYLMIWGGGNHKTRVQLGPRVTNFCKRMEKKSPGENDSRRLDMALVLGGSPANICSFSNHPKAGPLTLELPVFCRGLGAVPFARWGGIPPGD